jgi:hypothetical protein
MRWHYGIHAAHAIHSQLHLIKTEQIPKVQTTGMAQSLPKTACGGSLLMTPNELAKVRSKAASYAQTFLAKKYHDEYQELYNAYLVNRGVPTRKGKELIDERLVVNEQ